ncbi:hypothetical protein FRC03_002945 [Tulasnella sp. 419]|nr:hypothetical protein FRC03_002945 [Tulasnella sp. 419]
MAPPQAKSNKRRTRKRRRRAVDTSSSSSSSATSSEDERPSTVAVPMKKPATPEPASSSTSSASSSDSEDFNRIKQKKGSSTNITDVPLGRDTELPEDRPKRSPSPPVVKPLSFMASMEKSNSSDTMEKEKLLKERFRKFWMSSIADEFKNDLEEIRKVTKEGKHYRAFINP